MLYYPRCRCNNYVFTFLAFNTVISIIMGMFTSIEISIGVGFGLFALFWILGYRKEAVPMRKMTCLFLMTAIPILHSLFWDSGN